MYCPTASNPELASLPPSLSLSLRGYKRPTLSPPCIPLNITPDIHPCSGLTPRAQSLSNSRLVMCETAAASDIKSFYERCIDTQRRKCDLGGEFVV